MIVESIVSMVVGREVAVNTSEAIADAGAAATNELAKKSAQKYVGLYNMLDKICCESKEPGTLMKTQYFYLRIYMRN